MRTFVQKRCFVHHDQSLAIVLTEANFPAIIEKYALTETAYLKGRTRSIYTDFNWHLEQVCLVNELKVSNASDKKRYAASHVYM